MPQPTKQLEYALVVGSAPCVHDDLTLARKHVPVAAPVFAANLGGLVTYPDHVCTYHAELAEAFNLIISEKWGSKTWTVHSVEGRKPHHVDAFRANVDKFWPHDFREHGVNSGWLAARIAVAMGYAPVLCGCPMTGGDGTPYRMATHAAHSVGDLPKDSDPINAYHACLRRTHDAFPMVSSMSGTSRAILGAPQFMKGAA